MQFTLKEKYGIGDLLEIVALLRSPGGCPWDKEQTHLSIRRNFIEETYEAVEAIDSGDNALLLEELGDVLLQVLFHTQIEAEQNTFTFDDVCDGVCKKMIRRHPHIFPDAANETAAGDVRTPDDVLRNWDAIKQAEKNQSSFSDTLRSIPSALPALIRADKLQSKAAKSGFYGDSREEAIADIRGGLDKLENAVEQSGNAVSDEIGGLLFAAVNLARHFGTNPEDALSKASARFIERFANK
ncbi:MAG: nucleoside triphosphate pyrophosphohydrolase [Oscillospiraceae bacterium]|nr:nucleoside triphosphate pyrophosphohydrolase [Oscillospiraceae bacterium]